MFLARVRNRPPKRPVSNLKEHRCSTQCQYFHEISRIMIAQPARCLVEVRDSWMGYLVPARDGSGLLPDWESSWDVVVAVAAAVTWKFRLTFRPGNYIWSFQIGFWLIWELSGFWYRGSTQNFEPDWSSIVIWPGEPFWKKCLFNKYFPESHVHLLGTLCFWKYLLNK